MNTLHAMNHSPHSNQSGFVLIVALVLLLILTILGLAAAQSTSLEERMAGNNRDLDLAFQSAEAGLQAAENCLNANPGVCNAFTADTNGRYLFSPSNPPPPSTASTPLWEVSGFWDNSSNYLAYSTVSSTPIPSVADQPKIIIEQMPPVAMAGGNLGAQSYGGGSPSIQYYRITVLGTGGSNAATAMLQSMYQPN
jgi:type IV pilus assembly protein PilX